MLMGNGSVVLQRFAAVMCLRSKKTGESLEDLKKVME